jgi:hypothetical protein
MIERRRARLAQLMAAIAGAAIAAGCLERELTPLNPCLTSSVSRAVPVSDINKVDILFMVDNSESMAEEQTSLREQFPKLIDVLTTGSRGPDDPTPFQPVVDLHLGVVSSDMGTVGQMKVSGCDPDGGDDGRLQSVPRGMLGCQASYPSFLSYEAEHETPMQIADDFACIAELGTDGCGFEQQLEAPFKALWPSVYKDAHGELVMPNPYTFVGSSPKTRLGRGDLPAPDGSAGFLRLDPNAGLSLLAIVVLTDEDDCSASDPHLFTNDAKDPLSKQGPQVRCPMNPQLLYPTQRYIDGFKQLRPGYEQLVVFAAIVGVPPDLVDASARARVNFDDAQARDAYYQSLLDDPRMQNSVVVDVNPQRSTLAPSCMHVDRTGAVSTAAPPRRIVEVAAGFGENGIVQSICQDDFGPAMDAIIAVIAKKLGSVCLPRPLVRGSDGTVPCDVVWELPVAGTAPDTTPTECWQLGFLKQVTHGPLINERGGANCSVSQLAVTEPGTAPDGSGWFYDDFSSDVRASCLGVQRQRISFTKAAKPRSGVTIKLECLDQIQRLPLADDEVDAGVEQPGIGSSCAGVQRGDRSVSGDDACVVMRSGGPDHSLFCHPQQNVCVKSCTSATDCPASWECDARSETLAVTGGRAFCVNPTCGGN